MRRTGKAAVAAVAVFSIWLAGCDTNGTPSGSSSAGASAGSGGSSAGPPRVTRISSSWPRPAATAVRSPRASSSGLSVPFSKKTSIRSSLLSATISTSFSRQEAAASWFQGMKEKPPSVSESVGDTDRAAVFAALTDRLEPSVACRLRGQAITLLYNQGSHAVVISHDRWFLDRVATHVLAFEGDSQVKWFEGNVDAYEEDRRARLGDKADRPHRITYKKLTRN